MPYPGIAVFVIGASIAAVLYYMFASNQEEEEQRQRHQQHRQQNGQNNERYGRTPSLHSEPVYKWNDNSRRRRGTYSMLHEAAECSICLNTVKDDKTVVLDACRHVFHQKCIKKWESEAIEKVCPNCRHQFA